MTRHHSFENKSDGQSGVALLYVILVIVVISTLAAAISSFTSTGTLSQLNQIASAQARYMALAGYNYIRHFREDYIDLEGHTFTIPDVGQFTYTSVRKLPTMDTLYEVRVVGTVHDNTPNEANYVIFTQFNGESPGSITFRDDFDDFDTMTSDPNKVPIVKHDDKTFSIGHNINNAFGAMYYTGDKTLNWGRNICNYSDAGDPIGCDFKDGFRIFFVSSYDSNNANTADGIVFTFFGTNNSLGLNPYYSTPVTVCTTGDCPCWSCGAGYDGVKSFTSVGGDSQHGEMIGYAADGRVYRDYGSPSDVKYWLDPEQNGIQPPKIGIEFDNYVNSGTGWMCNYIYDHVVTSQRRDNNRDHIAYVFWGNDSLSDIDCAHYHQSWYRPYRDLYGNQATALGATTFDDNRHGDGLNQTSAEFWSSTFQWEDQPFAFRLEVERNVASGEYTLTSWIRRCSTANSTPCAEYFEYDPSNPSNDDIYFSDTSRFLCSNQGGFAVDTCSHFNAPILVKTFTLAADMHSKFEKFTFGFTEATGGQTQEARYSEFILSFVKDNDYDASGNKRRVIDYTID